MANEYYVGIAAASPPHLFSCFGAKFKLEPIDGAEVVLLPAICQLSNTAFIYMI